jgi:hypothetical protein
MGNQTLKIRKQMVMNDIADGKLLTGHIKLVKYFLARFALFGAKHANKHLEKIKVLRNNSSLEITLTRYQKVIELELVAQNSYCSVQAEAENPGFN